MEYHSPRYSDASTLGYTKEVIVSMALKARLPAYKSDDSSRGQPPKHLSSTPKPTTSSGSTATAAHLQSFSVNFDFFNGLGRTFYGFGG
ncbi:hypothetical protein FF1_043310 [Malus domestica]